MAAILEPPPEIRMTMLRGAEAMPHYLGLPCMRAVLPWRPCHVAYWLGLLFKPVSVCKRAKGPLHRGKRTGNRTQQRRSVFCAAPCPGPTILSKNRYDKACHVPFFPCPLGSKMQYIHARHHAQPRGQTDGACTRSYKQRACAGEIQSFVPTVLAHARQHFGLGDPR